MTWRAEDPQGNEAGKIRWEIVPYTRGKVLDLGCGPSKAFPHFIGIDSGKDTALFGTEMRPDVRVDDCADLSKTIQSRSCDAVFSSHLLDRLVDTVAALTSWWSCIRVGGYLVLYLPHKSFYPNIGQPGANPDHKHDFEPVDIINAMRAVIGRPGFADDENGSTPLEGWDLVERQSRNEDDEYSFYLVFQKRADQSCTFGHLRKRAPRKTACVVRYGGFGDMMQTANILPALKRQGYHVTLMTTPRGKEILEYDPHINDWYLQDPDQVPNADLNDFWAYHAKKYTRFINLCESVEGTLLSMPGRASHTWPAAVRDKRMNTNYLEFCADLAGVPYSNDLHFYPTGEESLIARERLLEDGLNVLWALAGSSCHKFYPHMDMVLADVLTEHPESRIFLVGDEACKILQQGWENEPRVVMLSGEIGIRDTLALAQAVDVVIGCETGVLNAVAFESNRKVVLLSHSSVENLTKHWHNTVSLTPRNTSCYPCHRLHYDWSFCQQDGRTGAAACQVDIPPADVYQALRAATPTVLEEAAA